MRRTARAEFTREEDVQFLDSYFVHLTDLRRRTQPPPSQHPQPRKHRPNLMAIARQMADMPESRHSRQSWYDHWHTRLRPVIRSAGAIARQYPESRYARNLVTAITERQHLSNASSAAITGNGDGPGLVLGAGAGDALWRSIPLIPTPPPPTPPPRQRSAEIGPVGEEWAAALALDSGRPEEGILALLRSCSDHRDHTRLVALRQCTEAQERAWVWTGADDTLVRRRLIERLAPTNVDLKAWNELCHEKGGLGVVRLRARFLSSSST
ncbi:hypothetical protein BC828DRAFT_391206 [Blastocladiella britannica]|nr:hypothetical protein BC828DRAFT_391206 [Blastocladiella britannica]